MRPNRHGIDRSQFDPERELDAVVGRYDPHAGTPWLARYGRWLARALVAFCLAVAVAATIGLILDRHMRAAETATPPPRPVPVTILPAR